MNTYTAFDLTIASDLEFPELIKGAEGGRVDVTITRSPKAPVPIDVERLDYDPIQGLTLAIPQVAKLTVRGGRLIDYQPVPNHNPDLLRVFLLGTGMGALLMQRGFLTLHANAIQVGDGLVLCAGPSGIGKSTLAAAFHQRGFEVFSDDLCAVDASGYSAMGIRRIKLWPESVAQLGLNPNAFHTIAAQLPKLQTFPTLETPVERLPVRRLYSLNVHAEPSILIEDINGVDRFPVIRSVLYVEQLLKTQGLEAGNLASLVSFARKTQIKRLSRPASHTAPGALVDAILADVAG